MPPRPSSSAPRFRFLGPGGLSSDAPGAPEAGYIALVPGEAAPLLPVVLPAGLRGAAREAVALRQLRDRLGAEASRLELRPAALGKAPFTALLALDPEQLAQWRGAAGKAAALLPDYLSLPGGEGLWAIRVLPEGRVLARLGPADGFAAESGLAALMLAEARRRGPLPLRLSLEGEAGPELQAALEGLPIMAATEAPLQAGELSLDLLRPPGSAAARIEARLRSALLPLVLLAIGALGWAAAETLETRRIGARVAALSTAITETVRRDFLPSGPLIDIPAQVGREIARREALAGSGAAGLALVQRAAVVLAGMGIVPESLGLRAGAPPELLLNLADPAALLEALAAAGIAAEAAAPDAEGRLLLVLGEAR